MLNFWGVGVGGSYSIGDLYVSTNTARLGMFYYHLAAPCWSRASGRDSWNKSTINEIIIMIIIIIIIIITILLLLLIIIIMIILLIIIMIISIAN